MTGPLSYIGGKNRLATTIISLLPSHTTYVEPFAGGAQVFFHKPPSKVEILNDLDGEIVNFFRICQSHYEELVRYLRFTVVSRRWFDLLLRGEPGTLTDIQRAARFFYIQKNAFGGLVLKQNYGYHIGKTPNYNPARIPEIIQKTHERLQNVQIESLPYQKILEKYDRKETLFYLDPPYWDRVLYKFNFKKEDFEELAKELAKLKGKFVLSLNDEPEVREIFSAFHISTADVTYTVPQKGDRKVQELLITNV
jgi:DNA adenine methylase